MTGTGIVEGQSYPVDEFVIRVDRAWADIATFDIRSGAERVKRLREAWVIARTAGCLGAVMVRMTPPPAPDAALGTNEGDIPIEVVEVFAKGRKPAEEAMMGISRQDGCPEDWRRQQVDMIPRLRQGYAAKDRKKYPDDTIILAYLNDAPSYTAVDSNFVLALQNIVDGKCRRYRRAVLWADNVFATGMANCKARMPV